MELSRKRQPSLCALFWAVLGAVLGLLLLLGNLPAASADAPAIYNFSEPNGSYPHSALIQASDGSFYGTTVEGYNLGYGTIFKMTAGGTPAGTALTTLRRFNKSNGAFPFAPLIQSDDGNFYGTTYEGGSHNKGTVFKMTPTGGIRTLVNFSGGNGNFPYAPLIQGSDRKLYGTTQYGGSDHSGTVFAIDPRAVEAVTFTPMTLSGGTSAMGEVTLSHIATSEMKVALTSSNPAVLPIRASVTITAGHRHALFTVTSKPVTTTTDVTIMA